MKYLIIPIGVTVVLLGLAYYVFATFWNYGGDIVGGILIGGILTLWAIFFAVKSL